MNWDHSVIFEIATKYCILNSFAHYEDYSTSSKSFLSTVLNTKIMVDHSLWWQRGFHNSMKLWAMPCKATQDTWLITTRSNKTCSTGGGNSSPLQYSCCENPMNIMKRQKLCDTGRWTSPSQKVSNMPLWRAEWLLIASERKKLLGQSRNDAQLWMCLVVKVKSNAVKNNIA